MVERRLIGHGIAEYARTGLGPPWPVSSKRTKRMSTSSGVIRIAALSDIHYSKSSQGSLQSLFNQIADSADVMLLCGDLTDYGLAEEARILAKDLAPAKIPVVAVLGNHDFESDQTTEIVKILNDVGVHMLDGD